MTMTPLPKTFVEKPWGRIDLPNGFDADGRRIGEVWFDRADVPLPVLIKWLFTSERLSVQVHPNDAQARARGLSSGKEECWFVVDAEPGATLGIGTKMPLSSDELRAAAQSGEIEHLLDWKAVTPGDWFHIPPCTVHAIGAGVTLVEVQQNADITYRLYDYGRPRELHLDDGVMVSEARPFSGYCGNINDAAHQQSLISTPNFQVSILMEGSATLVASTGPSLIVPLVKSHSKVNDLGQVGDVLYSEEEQEFEFRAAGPTLFIEWP